MKNSIRQKILIPLIVLTSCISAIGYMFVSSYFIHLLAHELKLRTENLTDAIRRSIEIADNRHNLERIINAYGDSEGLALIILTKGSPAKVIASTKHKYLEEKTQELNNILDASQVDEVYKSKSAIFEHWLEKNTYIASIPVLLPPQQGEIRPTLAVLSVHNHNTKIVGSFVDSKIFWVFLFTAALVLMAALIYTLLNKLIIKPVTHLGNIVSSIEKGQSNVRAQIFSNDEIGELATGVNNMLNRIKIDEDKQKNIMLELEKSEERLNLALDASDDGLWDINLDNDVIIVNKNWLRMLDHENTELQFSFEWWLNQTHTDDKDNFLKTWQEHLDEKNERFNFEYRIKTKQNEWLWVQVCGKIVENNSEGKPLRIVGTQSDISERKQAENLKDEFLSTINHELRTPLTAINGSISLLKNHFSANFSNQADNLLTLALRNSERLISLINDLLDISHLESGQLTYDFQKLELISLLKDSVEANKEYGVNFSVKLEFMSNLEECYVRGDYQRLSQVLSNLISNAVKSSSENSTVTVNVCPFENGVRVTIQDFGTGIPLKAQTHIFEKFFQVDASDTRKLGGTGLGLSISKHIIEHHKGTISFDSIPGKGTFFYIDLPEHQASKSETAQSSASA